MAKGQSATSSKAARSQAGANDIPVYEHGKSLYLNSVRLQRTVKDDSKTGLVCEVVSTCMEAGPPLAGEQYIVIWYGSDGYPDPHSMEEIKGDVLADMMQDTWELYPGTWPIPNDPDVELVCAPLQKVGWRVTEAEYLERREAARAARDALEAASTKLAKEMKQLLRKRGNKAKEDATAERPVKQQQESAHEDSEEEDSEQDSEGASEEPEGDAVMQHGHLMHRGHLGEEHFTEQVFGQPYELYYVQQQKPAQQQQGVGAQQQQQEGGVKQQQKQAAAESAQGTSPKAAAGRTGKTAAAAAAAAKPIAANPAAANPAAAKPTAAKPAAAKPAAVKPAAAAAAAAARPAPKKARKA